MKNILSCLLMLMVLVAPWSAAGMKQADGVKAPDPPGELRVLFIGNSLTYVNDLPAMVAALAATQQKRFTYQTVAFPDHSLEDHWQRGAARAALGRQRWDVVVLQQGPSGLATSRQMLLEYARKFDKEIRAAGAIPALYMVWPSAARFGDFDRVIESYRLVATEIKGILLPVGQAWRETWQRDAKMPLYAEEQFHPSVAGTYLAALVIYEKLFRQPALGLPANLRLSSNTLKQVALPPAQATLLQQAAAAANQKF